MRKNGETLREELGILKTKNLKHFCFYLFLVILLLLFRSEHTISIFILTCIFTLLVYSKHTKLQEAIKRELYEEYVYKVNKDEIIKNLEELKEVLDLKGIDAKESDYLELKRFYKTLDSCQTEMDFSVLRMSITITLLEHLQHVRRKQNTHSQSTKNNGSPNSKRASSELYNSLETLGLPSDTSDFNVIKKAYIRSMKLYHPDVNKSDEAVKKSQDINNAFAFLKSHFNNSQVNSY